MTKAHHAACNDSGCAYGASHLGKSKYDLDLEKKFKRYVAKAQALGKKIQEGKKHHADFEEVKAAARKNVGYHSDDERKEENSRCLKKNHAEKDHKKKAAKAHEDEYQRDDASHKHAHEKAEHDEDKRAFAQKDRKVCKQHDRNKHKRRKFHVRQFYEKKWEEDDKASDDEKCFAKDESKCAKKHKECSDKKKDCEAKHRDQVCKERKAKAHCAEADKHDKKAKACAEHHSEYERSDDEKDYSAAYCKAAKCAEEDDKFFHDKKAAARCCAEDAKANSKHKDFDKHHHVHDKVHKKNWAARKAVDDCSDSDSDSSCSSFGSGFSGKNLCYANKGGCHNNWNDGSDSESAWSEKSW